MEHSPASVWHRPAGLEGSSACFGPSAPAHIVASARTKQASNLQFTWQVTRPHVGLCGAHVAFCARLRHSQTTSQAVAAVAVVARPSRSHSRSRSRPPLMAEIRLRAAAAAAAATGRHTAFWGSLPCHPPCLKVRCLQPCTRGHLQRSRAP